MVFVSSDCWSDACFLMMISAIANTRPARARTNTPILFFIVHEKCRGYAPLARAYLRGGLNKHQPLLHCIMKIPREVPVMTLPNATLFPQALLPLYIFEPRYRQMLAEALHTNRMFSVAMQKPGNSRETPAFIAGL